MAESSGSAIVLYTATTFRSYGIFSNPRVSPAFQKASAGSFNNTTVFFEHGCATFLGYRGNVLRVLTFVARYKISGSMGTG
ncbi:uncharacterized protein METZ01_LOCUS308296, partial [marine metagenome]